MSTRTFILISRIVCVLFTLVTAITLCILVVSTVLALVKGMARHDAFSNMAAGVIPLLMVAAPAVFFGLFGYGPLKPKMPKKRDADSANKTK
jgi:hypothetical protein